VIVASLLTTGCAAADPGSASSTPAPARAESTSTQGHAGRFAGAVDEKYRYDDPGIEITPPPESAKPDIPWTSAFDACFDSRLPCVIHGDASVSLGIVTGPDNAVINGRRMFENALAYLVVWQPSACLRPDLAGQQCRDVDLVTAADGNVEAGTHVYTFEVPESSPAPDA